MRNSSLYKDISEAGATGRAPTPALSRAADGSPVMLGLMRFETVNVVAIGGEESFTTEDTAGTEISSR